MHRLAPTAKDYLAPNASSAEVEKPCSRLFSKSCNNGIKFPCVPHLWGRGACEETYFLFFSFLSFPFFFFSLTAPMAGGNSQATVRPRQILKLMSPQGTPRSYISFLKNVFNKFFLTFVLFLATPMACGSSQVRGPAK